MSRMWLAAMNMAMLYGGRVSGLLVAFVFLPSFSRLLGPEQFGTVAVIFSFQALLVMMDLGMSVMVGREVAVASASPARSLVKLIRTAEFSLTAFYVILLLMALLATGLNVISGLSWATVVGTVFLFWVLVLQNLSYSALIARREYMRGSLVQIVGVLVRACASLAVLWFYSATLEAFVLTQLVCGAAHWVITRYIGLKLLASAEPADAGDPRVTVADAVSLTKAGGALVLFSAAGAAVLQLDKPLISMFASAASVSPYYLASLLCMTPIAILAGPISQYFQPAVLRAGAGPQTGRVLKLFVLSIFAVTAIPTVILWLLRSQIIGLWLGDGADVVTVSRYVGILLPGVALGALGFVPYSLLLLAKDFRFQALLSTAMTVVTLVLASYAASERNIEAVCFIYSAYHAVSTIASWLRASTRPEVRTYAWRSGVLALLLMTGLTGALVLAKITIY